MSETKSASLVERLWDAYNDGISGIAKDSCDRCGVSLEHCLKTGECDTALFLQAHNALRLSSPEGTANDLQGPARGASSAQESVRTKHGHFLPASSPEGTRGQWLVGWLSNGVVMCGCDGTNTGDPCDACRVREEVLRALSSPSSAPAETTLVSDLKKLLPMPSAPAATPAHNPPAVHHCCVPSNLEGAPPMGAWCYHTRTWVDGAAQQDDYECGRCKTRITVNVSEWASPRVSAATPAPALANECNAAAVGLANLWVELKLKDDPEREKVTAARDCLYRAANHLRYRLLAAERPAPTCATCSKWLMMGYPEETSSVGECHDTSVMETNANRPPMTRDTFGCTLYEPAPPGSGAQEKDK